MTSQRDIAGGAILWRRRYAENEDVPVSEGDLEQRLRNVEKKLVRLDAEMAAIDLALKALPASAAGEVTHVFRNNIKREAQQAKTADVHGRMVAAKLRVIASLVAAEAA